MSRIKVDIPDQNPIFQTSIDVVISDINYGGHLGNEKILSMCHEVRLRFLKSREFSETDLLGKGIIMSDAAISYKMESFHGDTLETQLFVDDITDYGFDLYYLIRNKKTLKSVANAKTGIVFFDYEKGKIFNMGKEIISEFFN